MTWAQRKGLLIAAKNGGRIAAGQGVRKDVIERLWREGYLELAGSIMTGDDWILTQAGRDAISSLS